MRSTTNSRRWAFAAKRLFDIVVSFTLLVFLTPVWLLISSAVLLSSGWPIIVRIERIGRGGKPFMVYKFRTMAKDAKIREHEVYKSINLDFRRLPDDPRVTSIGRSLRRCSIDELPQLWNVFKGDMSLVGPRPIDVAMALIDPKYNLNLKEMRPGMTGLAQIYDHGNITLGQQSRLGGWYVRLWCLRLDLAILFKTIPLIWRGHGAI